MQKLKWSILLLLVRLLIPICCGVEYDRLREDNRNATAATNNSKKSPTEKKEEQKKLIRKHQSCTPNLCKNNGICHIRKEFIQEFKKAVLGVQTRYLKSKLSIRVYKLWLRDQVGKNPYKKWKVFCSCPDTWRNFATDCATPHPKAKCREHTCKHSGRCYDLKFFFVEKDFADFKLTATRKRWLQDQLIRPGKTKKYICSCTGAYQPRTDCSTAYPAYEKSACYPNGLNGSTPCHNTELGSVCHLPQAYVGGAGPLALSLEQRWDSLNLSSRKYVCDCTRGWDFETDCATRCKYPQWGSGCFSWCHACDKDQCDSEVGCKTCRDRWSGKPACWKAKCIDGNGAPLCINGGTCHEYKKKYKKQRFSFTVVGFNPTYCSCTKDWQGLECHLPKLNDVETAEQTPAGASASADCGVCLDGAQCDLKTGECPAGCHQLFTTKFCNQTKPGATVMEVEIRGRLTLHKVGSISKEEGEKLLIMLQNHLSASVREFTIGSPQFTVEAFAPAQTGDLIDLTRRSLNHSVVGHQLQPIKRRGAQWQMSVKSKQKKVRRGRRQVSGSGELRVNFSTSFDMEGSISAAEARKTMVTAIRENAGNFNNDVGATIDRNSVEVTVVAIQRYLSVSASTSEQTSSSDVSKTIVLIISVCAVAAFLALLALSVAFVMFRKRHFVNAKSATTPVPFISQKKLRSSRGGNERK